MSDPFQPTRYVADNREDIETARATLGEDARPTGRVRIVKNHPARDGMVFDVQFEQEWRGEFGVGWLAIPTVEYR